MSGYQPRVCEHGHSSSCPEDYVLQMRLRWGPWSADPRGKDDDWQTHTVSACDVSRDGLRRQVVPVLRKRGYETRFTRVGDLP